MTIHPSELRSKGTEMDIETMAMMAGLQTRYFDEWASDQTDGVRESDLQRFAAIVAEECAKIAESGHEGDLSKSTGDYDARLGLDIAAAIRAKFKAQSGQA